MTLEQIIKLLKTDGIGSKRVVYKMLENASINELCELKRDLSTIIAQKRANHENNNPCVSERK
jgi:hypothetical protein|nr:MAG TPA: hypothetical protein [Caudoviricetes sp.]